MAAILSNVTRLPDILTCSAVCKTWYAARGKLQLQALQIPADFESGRLEPSQRIDEDGLDSTVRLIQQWHMAGTFQYLTSLSLYLELECTEACRDSGKLPGFITSILTVAGMWNSLQHCLIHADVDMEVPASLLPCSLQSLDISFRSHENVKKNMPLSVLHTFSSLKSLVLDPVEWSLNEDAPETFVLQSRFEHLTKLDLGYLPLQVSEGFTLSACLPRLTDLHVCVFPGKAQAVLDLPSLKKLELELLCKAFDPMLTLLVPASSQLQVLDVWASTDSHVVLDVQKHDLRFRCGRVRVQYNWSGLYQIFR